jgi:serine phosphatase RsbU (regulator of sigma subunit)
MAILVILQGPDVGRKFPLPPGVTVIGRQLDSPICLPPKAVSRQHAQIVCEGGVFFVEDLGSSNGTYLNGVRVEGRQPLTERDTLQIGPYLFALRLSPTLTTTESNLIIRESISVASLSQSIPGQDPTQKLQVVLEIAQHLARTLDLEPLLDKLLDHLIRLFPQADRGMVLLCEGDRLVVRGQRCRHQEDASTYPYSRTIVQRALNEGIGILSDDVHSDHRFQASATITSLDMRSLLCVPLIAQDGRRLGVIQLDRFRPGGVPFRLEDLHLLTTVSLQVTVVLENAYLHAELLREERLHQELAMAREIQQGFLPSDFDDLKTAGFELFARVDPAREVCGDLYDFFTLPDGRLVFFVGDVSGKGMPAALFMIAVRTLSRHLASTGISPAETLVKLNSALAADNPSAMFVTLAHGIYTPSTGEVLLASGGHPAPLYRRVNGQAEELPLRSGRLLGVSGGDLRLSDVRLTLAPAETLVFYTDGYTEARAPGTKNMFGVEHLKTVVEGFEPSLPLPACADRAKAAVTQYIASKELQDDLTLFLLRRSSAPGK